MTLGNMRKLQNCLQKSLKKSKLKLMKLVEWRFPKKTQRTFLKTNSGRNIILLDYYGYHIVEKQSDMTVLQEMFILKGRYELDKEIAEAEENEIKNLSKK